MFIVPAGNSRKREDLPWATNILVAESVNLDGSRSEFSSEVKGSLGAVGELPTVDLTQAGPTVVVGTGTGYAAAALAAIAVESVARQPTLKGAALRDALISAAAFDQGCGVLIEK
jgi:F0F1-type ATP synthase membrane subunit c/vacuolar-type H+-ATPase subunit K